MKNLECFPVAEPLRRHSAFMCGFFAIKHIKFSTCVRKSLLRRNASHIWDGVCGATSTMPNWNCLGDSLLDITTRSYSMLRDFAEMRDWIGSWVQPEITRVSLLTLWKIEWNYSWSRWGGTCINWFCQDAYRRTSCYKVILCAGLSH